MKLTRSLTFSVLSYRHDVGHRGNVVPGAVVDAGCKAKPLDEYSRWRCQDETTTHDLMYLRPGFLKTMPEGLDNDRGGIVRMNARGVRLYRFHEGAVRLP